MLILIPSFPSERDFFRSLQKMDERRGVQIFYDESRGFSQFLLEQEDLSLLDNCGVEISTPISGDLVLGVVPLGRYEQACFLSNSNFKIEDT